MSYSVPPPPPIVQVANVSPADTPHLPETAAPSRQVLLPEPLSPMPLTALPLQPASTLQPALTPQPELMAQVVSPGSATSSQDLSSQDLGTALNIGLPESGSLPGSYLGDLHRDYGIDEDKAQALEAEARSQLNSDNAPYEETRRLLFESRVVFHELMDWVTQQPALTAQPSIAEASDTTSDIAPNAATDAATERLGQSDPADDRLPASPTPPDLQAPLPTAPTNNGQPETNAIPLEDLELEPPGEAASVDAIEVLADRQLYDQQQQVFTAEGNVILTVRGAVLTADQVRVNLPNQVAIATGDVVFTRGQQVLRGDSLEYNFVREEGAFLDARGEVFIPQIGSDLSGERPIDDPAAASPNSSVDSLDPEQDVLSQRLQRQQPPVETATVTGGVTIGAGVGPQGFGGQGAASGGVRQLRFEAERIDFYPNGWEAANVRLTNDPFSPPELEIRTNRATFERQTATRSELRLKNPRLVIDRGFTLPLLRSRFVFDQRRQNNALPIQFGFDDDDRDGLFAERPFDIIATPGVQFTVTPQVLIQRAFTGRDEDDIDPGEDDTGVLNPNSYGLTSDLNIDFDPKTSLEAEVVMTSLDFDGNFADEDLRGLVRLQRQFGRGYNATAEYNYRDRLFNGTLGFQTVDQSYGLILTSPNIELGDSGATLRYQGAIQRIQDDIAGDVIDDLLGPFSERDDNVTTLTRYQIAAELRRFFLLWAGTPLPATPDQGLRYTPQPVVPFIGFNPRLQGVAGFYSSGDTQPILTGVLSFVGQFGHFSRPAFDYLGFNVTYRRSTEGSESPFNFDRVPDREVLSGGLTAQLFGPIRVGFQTSISLDEDEDFDTSFSVEYSRRTFGLLLRINPDRETGSLNLRISDFNWEGTPRRFDAEPVEEEPEVVPLDETTLDVPPEALDEAAESLGIDLKAVKTEAIETEAVDTIEVVPARPAPADTPIPTEP